MARNLQYICGTVLLCIVILLVTGVTFPKYIESHNLKKRAVFNSSVAVFKLVSKEKLISNRADFGNSSSYASKEIENSSRSSFLQSIASNRLQNPVKGKRLKRDADSQKNSNEVLSWNFSLNVSRSERTAIHEATKNELVPSDRKKLGVSVHVNSQGTQETAIGELQRALNSLASFLKNVFGSGSVNRTYDFKGIDKGENEHLVKESQSALTQYFNIRSNAEKGIEPETIPENITESFREASLVSELVTAQNPNSQNIDKSRNESSLKADRKGRIFFNIFDLKGKLLGRTVPEIETTKNSMDISQTETNILRGENIPDHVPWQKSEWVTENSNQGTSLNSDSLESSVKFLANDSDNTENLPFQQIMQSADCSGCVTGGLEFQSIPNKEESGNTMLETMKSTETVFTDEILENFCKSIPNDLGQFHPSLLTDEESETDVTIEESSLKNMEDATQFTVQTDKESRFFSLFDSGSGRSDIASDEKNLTSLDLMNEFTKSPSISDCLLFFSKKLNTKTVLNTNDVENKIFSNFENTSVIFNLEEQLQFSTHINSSVQTLDEIPEGTESDLRKSKSSLGDENNFTVRDVSEKQEETNSKSKDFNLSDKDISESRDSDGIEKTFHDRRDGKFLSFFGFGSGSDQENGSLSERFFNSFFSSGARSLDDSGDLEETVDLGSGDSSLDIEGFSGDDIMFPISDRDLSEDFSITSGEDLRFLSLLGFAGSGDGRELTENSEVIFTELSDIECSNCSYGVKKLNKCDGYECNFENVLDLENIESTEYGTLIPFNESDCFDDCYPNVQLLNRDNSSISTSETSGNKNVTYFPEKSQKCSCFRGNNFTDKKEVIPECDCISDTLQTSDASYVDLENNFSTDIYLSKEIEDLSHLHEVDNTDFTTFSLDFKNTEESLHEVHKTIGIIDEYENCNDCNHEKFSEKPTLATPSLLETSELTSEIKTNDNAYKEIEGLSHLHEDNNTDFTTFSLDSINTEESLHQVDKTTVTKHRHFVGTIFLTGSGDGGLFGDDNKPINLEEEVRTVNPLIHSRRRGRLDDLSNLPEVMQEKGLEIPQTNQTETPFRSSPTIQFGDEIATSPISRSKEEEIILKENVSDTENIKFPVMISNEPSSSNAPPDLRYRPCVGAIDCNATLGERCIKVNYTSVCQCGRTFVHHKLTRKCVAKRHVETSLKLPAEIFHSDLRYPESTIYKSTSKKSVDTMWLLLDETPDILQIVADVSVSKFTAGSLIVSMYLVLAVDNESHVELLKGIEEKLQKALLNENLMKRASLNIRNATVLSVTSELDPCMLEEFNYCSKNAYCKRKEGNQGSYTCYCKEHFLDVSSDPLFPGEKCIDKCPPSYCGPNGHCEIIENERHCLCNGMHFGERCEIPGMIILCSLTVTAFVSLLVLCAVIIKLRCRKTSYGGSPTFHRSEDIGPQITAAGRVSDAIALAENPRAKVSKFAQISTPVVPPMIKITQPTLNESSISFDCDSSFDVTPTQEQAESPAS